MYKEKWGLKRICPMCNKQYYDLGREKLDCPECEKEIEVSTLFRPRRGRKPGSTNSTPLSNDNPQNVEKKDENLDIENLNIDSENESLDDDSVLIEDDNDIDPAVDVGIKPTEEDKENL
ncbi:MAG: hypothetical protein CFH19_00135 [Alphaproteobacteria bacterium MarineAlpha5_Bin9]|nr:MAG: hypothetical protein CFH19_00135 [Alphaproteobacteria bacterium MarineAlpha5_Bin9]|tara:strand:- start:7021 stop:7377 length:357 start_codon:yes stop_codon:yes gene_type:complete